MGMARVFQHGYGCGLIFYERGVRGIRVFHFICYIIYFFDLGFIGVAGCWELENYFIYLFFFFYLYSINEVWSLLTYLMTRNIYLP